MSKLRSLPKKLLFIVPLIVGILVGVSIVAIQAKADSSNYFTGCIGNVAPNLLYNVKLGTSPSSPCNTGDNQVAADYGDITSIIAGTGLTGGATQGDATVGIANGGVGTAQLADGSVTDTKIADGASESARIYTWADDDDNSVSALSTPPSLTIPTSISVTVPTGKAYYYQVEYDGLFEYLYSERNSSNTSFFGQWDAMLLANDTPVGAYDERIVNTGYRMDWSSAGDNNYWVFPYHVSWPIRLTEGTYTFKVTLENGYSDNTMTYAHFKTQRMQVLRVF